MAKFEPKELIYRVKLDAKGMEIIYQGELVRCRDCKYMDDYGEDIVCLKRPMICLPHDFFCADGERR